MSEELKPCPFCGGEADIRWHQSDCFVVSCTVCCAEGPPASGDEMQAAIAAWNTRAQPEAALEALAEVLCTERCAQSGDPPCSKAAPDEPHCDECLGMAQAVIEHRAEPEAAPVEPVAWLYTDEEGGTVACVLEQIEPPFEGWTEPPLYAHPPAAPTDALVEALREMLEAVCGETGFAQAVRAESGLAYPWPALDLAEAKARAALAAMQEPKQ